MTSNPIHFFKSKEMGVYDKLADALEAMAEDMPSTYDHVIPVVTTLLALNTRAHAFFFDITQAEMKFSNDLVV